MLKGSREWWVWKVWLSRREGRETRKGRRDADANANATNFGALAERLKLAPQPQSAGYLLAHIFLLSISAWKHVEVLLSIEVMRPALRLVCTPWKYHNLIRLRWPCILDNHNRKFSRSLAWADDSSRQASYVPVDDHVNVAFDTEHRAKYFRDRQTLSRSEVARNTMIRGLGPLSASDTEIQKQLCQPGSRPADIMRRSIDQSNVSPHVIHLCLETQYGRVAKLPRKARPKMLDQQKQDGLVRIILRFRRSMRSE